MGLDYERWLRLHPVWPLRLGCELLAGLDPSTQSRQLLDAYTSGELPDADFDTLSHEEARRVFSIAEEHVRGGRLVARSECLANGTVHWVYQYHLLSWASIGAKDVALSEELKQARDRYAIADPQAAQLLAAMSSTNDRKERQSRMNRVFVEKPTPPGPSAIYPSSTREPPA